MKKTIFLLLAGTMMAACSFRGFKPAPDASASWRLNEFYDKTGDDLYAYVVKRDEDFQACGIDPVGGNFVGSRENPHLHTRGAGYLCIEEKGWYNTKGPICLKHWLYFKDPECVAWRQARGLSNAPKPPKPSGSTNY